MALTVSEVARTLAYSKSNVLNLIRSGELTALPRTNPRGKYLIDEAEFARYQERIASRDKTGREFAYVLLNRYISQLPDNFDRSRVDKSLANLAIELNSASLALGPLQHPYQYWSGMLAEISASLEVLRRSDLFNTMLSTDTMRLLPLLEQDLRVCIRKLRSSLAGKEDPALTRDILHFRDTVIEWSGFCASWANFRDAGVRCFTTRRSEEKYGELKHSGSVVVYDTRLRREIIWNAFGLVYQPTVVANMARWLARVTQLLEWQFDTVCSLSAAALQLSSFLAWELHKNVVALDNQTFEFQPPEPPGSSYVLIDTVCQTGSHLLQSIDKASKHNKKIAGAIFITLNDMMFEEEKRRRLQIIEDLRNQGRLIYCYDISHLYRNLSVEHLMAADTAGGYGVTK
ncbi:MAG: helix-turn-helix domain-containing protein [Chloroflexi bacterium]|nr:helix-turn-helix domain-containing protein [Chloroflexota bacterium]